MKNPYTCDNCLYNPIQYHEVGTRVGFCLKYDCLLKNSAHTTCHYLNRKDLPFFLTAEGHAEHAEQFSADEGIVFYYARHPEPIKRYSECHVWLTNTYDPYLQEVAVYHRTPKKWTFIQATMASRNPIKSIMSSSLTRRYIQQCGPQRDNYRLVLSITNDLKEMVDLQISDFRFELSPEEYSEIKEIYLKDLKLLQLYAIQEYGQLTSNEKITWISDELNGSLFLSWKDFFSSVIQLVPLVQAYIVESARERGTFFPQPNEEESYFLEEDPVDRESL